MPKVQNGKAERGGGIAVWGSCDQVCDHVLTNVLGASEQVEIHVSEHSLSGGDALLLCSDGVHDVLDQPALAQLLSTAAAPHAAAQSVVAAALERGTHDNVTALLVHYNGGRT